MPPRPLPNPEIEPVPVAPRRPDPPSTLLLAFWIAVQLGGLALAWLHVPLANKYPPGERLGVEILLILQMGVGSLLAAAWARRPATFLLALATTWPLLLLAGAIASRPVTPTALAGGIVSLWLATVFLWALLFRSPSLRALVGGVAAVIAIGSAVAGYLAMEFGTDPSATSIAGLRWDLLPTPLALGVANQLTPAFDAWRIALLLAIGGMLCSAVRGIPHFAPWRHSPFD